MGGFLNFLGKVFKPVGNFIGKAVKGVGKAASWLGSKLSPVLSIGSGIVRDIASNPLAQMGATAIFGPSAGAMLNTVGTAANVINQAVGHRPSQAGNMVGGMIRGANDLASMQQRYTQLRNQQ